MRLLPVAAAIAALAIGAASPASAHWHNTRWNMTDAEVRAVWPSATERKESDHFLLGVDGPVAVGGMTYSSIRFIFDTKGRLKVVRLEAPVSYDTVSEAMTSQLGAPATSEDKPFTVGGVRIKEALYRDTVKGNTISLFGFTGSSTLPPKTTLTYKPIATGF